MTSGPAVDCNNSSFPRYFASVFAVSTCQVCQLTSNWCDNFQSIPLGFFILTQLRVLAHADWIFPEPQLYLSIESCCRWDALSLLRSVKLSIIACLLHQNGTKVVWGNVIWLWSAIAPCDLCWHDTACMCFQFWLKPLFLGYQLMGYVLIWFPSMQYTLLSWI